MLGSLNFTGQLQIHNYKYNFNYRHCGNHRSITITITRQLNYTVACNYSITTVIIQLIHKVVTMSTLGFKGDIIAGTGR